MRQLRGARRPSGVGISGPGGRWVRRFDCATTMGVSAADGRSASWAEFQAECPGIGGSGIRPTCGGGRPGSLGDRDHYEIEHVDVIQAIAAIGVIAALSPIVAFDATIVGGAAPARRLPDRLRPKPRYQ